MKDRNPLKICVPIIERTEGEAIQVMAKARPLADLVELRVDYMKNPGLEILLRGRKMPCIVTNRRREEGGRYRGEEKNRLAILREAMDLGSEFVDVELASDPPFFDGLIGHHGKTSLILSSHDFQKTPSLKELRSLCRRMICYGAQVIKIVTFIQSWEDNLKILSLIPYAMEREQKIVALGMGVKGKLSRIFAPLMGAEWTYAPLIRGRASAPGQITARALKEVWEGLK
jgi:3-dehydroquinate dehydratase type I